MNNRKRLDILYAKAFTKVLKTYPFMIRRQRSQPPFFYNWLTSLEVLLKMYWYKCVFPAGPPCTTIDKALDEASARGSSCFASAFLLGNLVSNRRACFVGLVGLSSSLRKYPLYLISPVCPFPSPNYFGAKNSFPLFNSMETSS